MNLEIASPKNSFELNEFFSQFTLRGLVDLKIQRKKDFFAPYKLQSDDYRTYMLRDSDGDIQAIASFLFRETAYDGHPTKIATALDLRVAPNRKAIIEWSNHFLPVMQSITDEMKVEFIFSAINLADPSALNTFVRPRQMKRPIPRYHLYRKYNLVSLHGKWPWAKAPLKSVRFQNCHDGIEEALIEYILKRSQYRPFSSTWNREALLNKIKHLPGLKKSDFIVATDHQGNVVGCTAPWSPHEIQDYIPLSYSLRAHNFRQMLKFFWMFGMTHRLTKPVASTGIEQKLNYSHLTHLHADNEDVFEGLIATAFEQCSSQDFLLYAHAVQDYRLLPPRSWISASLPFALYAVVPPQKPMPAFLHPSISLNPELESCYLF